jgi:hypothetical protein
MAVFPREHLDEDHAEREQVGPGVELIEPAGLFRRDIAGRADHQRECRRVERSRQAEVAEQEPLVRGQSGDRRVMAARRRGREQHVARLHVAVQVSHAVHVVDRACDLGDDRHRPWHLEPGARTTDLTDPIGECAAVGPRHHDVRALVCGLTGRVPANEARALGRQDDVRLVQEPTPDLVVEAPVVGQHLDRHRTVEQFVARQPHRAEIARTDDAFEPVVPDPVASDHAANLVIRGTCDTPRHERRRPRRAGRARSIR